MKVKKLFKGILPVVIVLSLMLFAVAPVVADEPVEPLVVNILEADVPFVYNDGTGVFNFNWNISAWDIPQYGSAVYYEFQITDDLLTTVFFTQRSDPASGNFTTPVNPLQNVVGKNGSPGQEIFQPEYAAKHPWTVPAGLRAGGYSGRVVAHLTGGNVVATCPLAIRQATGNLRVIKQDDHGSPLSGWAFNIQGGNVPTNRNGVTVGTGNYTFVNVPVGTYTVTETMKPLWTSIDPGEPGPYIKPATVVYNTTETVTFVNEPVPGDLTIFKYRDVAPLGSWEAEPGLAGGWQFHVVGPGTDTYVTTGGSGTYTLTGLAPGSYTVTETDAKIAPGGGWRCTDPAGVLKQKVAVLSAGVSETLRFGNQELGNLIIFKYNDADASGTYNAGDTPWAGWGFQVSGVIGTFVTDGTGYVTVPNLVPGTYAVTEGSGPPPPPGFTYECTDPGSGKQKSGIVVPSGGSSDEVFFGNHIIEHVVPTLGQWGIIAMSAAFVGLLVWFGMRRRRLT